MPGGCRIPARMGFDPRRWRPSPGGRPVTANVEALLAENDALRRQNGALLRELHALQQQLELGRQAARRQVHSRVTNSAAPGLTAEQVERWSAAMARHPAWTELRLGPPGGLRALVEELRRHWWNPALSLEEELDRRSPGLGGELAAALRGPHSRGRWAVRAAFALYGPRAPEWLAEEPLRVVDELRRRLERLEGQQRQQRRRGTRTENHSQGGGNTRSGSRSRASRSPDPLLEALRLLGLEQGASREAIKRAYRRLAKAHHPDLGGDPEAFHRLDAAYRLLLG
jgi:hypothetical protein